MTEVLLQGDEVCEAEGFIKGHGTDGDGHSITSTYFGRVHQINKLITVVPVCSLRYAPEAGDVVVGRVTQIYNKRWRVETETNDESSFEKDCDKIIKREGDSFMVEKNAVPTIQLKLVSNGFYPICHTPFCSEPLRNKWIVYHKINDKIQNSIVILDAFESTKKIKLSLPSVSTKDHVKVYVSSNGYFGNDVSSSLTIKPY